MTGAKLNFNLKATAAALFIVCLAALLIFKIGIMDRGKVASGGLSGLVAVKGTVSAEALGLNSDEVKKINRTVEAHKSTFTKVNVFLDTKDGGNPADSGAVLVMALVLDTDEDCEVRSWSRKVERRELVSQLILYMDKAAKEYVKFKQYPDVKQNFKCLYI